MLSIVKVYSSDQLSEEVCLAGDKTSRNYLLWLKTYKLRRLKKIRRHTRRSHLDKILVGRVIPNRVTDRISCKLYENYTWLSYLAGNINRRPLKDLVPVMTQHWKRIQLYSVKSHRGARTNVVGSLTGHQHRHSSLPTAGCTTVTIATDIHINIAAYTDQEQQRSPPFKRRIGWHSGAYHCPQ